MKKLFIALLFVLCTAVTACGWDDPVQGKYAEVYYENDSTEYLAQRATVMADSMVELLFHRLGSENLIKEEKQRIPIFLYATVPDFGRTEIGLEPPGEGVQGFTELIRNRVVLPFQGSWLDFEHVLCHELTHAVMLKILKASRKGRRLLAPVYEIGGAIVESVSEGPEEYSHQHDPPGLFIRIDILNKFNYGGMGTSNTLPLWFIEGLAEYMSRPDDSDMELYLRDAWKYNYLPLSISRLSRNPNYVTIYKAGESIVRFIVDNYGEEKLGNIVHASYDSTFSSTLRKAIGKKMNLKFLSEKWDQSLKKRFTSTLDDPAIDSVAANAYSKRPIAWAPTTYGARGVFYTIMRSQIVLHDGKRILKGDRAAGLNTLHIFRKGIFLYGNQLLFVKGQEYDELWTMNVRTRKCNLIYKASDIATITHPSYIKGTIGFIARTKTGKSLIIALTAKQEARLNFKCDIRSLALVKGGLAFIGDYEKTGEYHVYLYSWGIKKPVRVENSANAYDLSLNKYEKRRLIFLTKHGADAKLHLVDFSKQTHKISSPISSLLMFPEETQVGKVTITGLNRGYYGNYSIDLSKLTFVSDSLGIDTTKIKSEALPFKYEVKKVSSKWDIDLGQIGAGYSERFGVQSNLTACLKSLDGKKEIYFQLSERSIGSMYVNKSYKNTYVLAAYSYRSYFWRSIDVIHENSVAAFGGYSWRPNYYTRLTTTLTVQLRHRRFMWRDPRSLYARAFLYHKFGDNSIRYNNLYNGFRNIPKFDFSNFLNFDEQYALDSKGVVSTNSIILVRDNARYGGFWMPVAGKRLLLMGSIDYDYTNKKIPELIVVGEFVKYFYVHRNMSCVTRMAFGSSWGAYPYLFELGGPQSIRGFKWGSMVGRQYLFGNAEIRLPLSIAAGLFGLFNQPESFLGFHHLKIRLFTDVGKLWNQWPYNDSNTYYSMGFGLGAWFGFAPINVDWIRTNYREGFHPTFSISYDF